MPVSCPIDFPRISEDEMRIGDRTVMRHAMDSYNELGRLCDESVFNNDLNRRLVNAGMDVVVRVPIVLSFREFSLTFYLDLVVYQKVIYELKVVSALTPEHEAQLLNYLFLTNSTRGKLINFRTSSLTWRFVNTNYDLVQRRAFELDVERFTGEKTLSELIQEIVKDWGTGYSASHYRRAISYFVTGQDECDHMLPMRLNKITIGSQRFHLLDKLTALGVTTYGKISSSHEREFSQLLTASPLARLHWLNVALGRVQLVTISK